MPGRLAWAFPMQSGHPQRRAQAHGRRSLTTDPHLLHHPLDELPAQGARARREPAPPRGRRDPQGSSSSTTPTTRRCRSSTGVDCLSTACLGLPRAHGPGDRDVLRPGRVRHRDQAAAAAGGCSRTPTRSSTWTPTPTSLRRWSSCRRRSRRRPAASCSRRTSSAAAARRGASPTGTCCWSGVNNLGFCGFDRRALDFLDWWWGHLRTECLYDPLAGLFVDQKWMDIGATLFEAATFRHAGYNVGVGNLCERPLARGRRRLLHRLDRRPAAAVPLPRVRLQLAREALGALPPHGRQRAAGRQRRAPAVQGVRRRPVGYEQSLPPAPPYPYGPTPGGGRISRQLRRAYLAGVAGRGGARCPRPSSRSDAAAYERWRRRAWRPIARGLLGETAKCVRIVLPEEYDTISKRFPELAERLNDRFSGGAGMWG